VLVFHDEQGGTRIDVTARTAPWPTTQPSPPGMATCSPWRARAGWCLGGGWRPRMLRWTWS